MQTKSSASHQASFLMPTLGEQLDPRQGDLGWKLNTRLTG